eukprot:4597876-Prorocentrum_lima.AAC.1
MGRLFESLLATCGLCWPQWLGIGIADTTWILRIQARARGPFCHKMSSSSARGAESFELAPWNSLA